MLGVEDIKVETNEEERISIRDEFLETATAQEQKEEIQWKTELPSPQSRYTICDHLARVLEEFEIPVDLPGTVSAKQVEYIRAFVLYTSMLLRDLVIFCPVVRTADLGVEFSTRFVGTDYANLFVNATTFQDFLLNMLPNFSIQPHQLIANILEPGQKLEKTVVANMAADLIKVIRALKYTLASDGVANPLLDWPHGLAKEIPKLH